MAVTRTPPYVAVSWVARLLVGDVECGYSTRFRAHHTYDKLPTGFDAARWRLQHAPMVREAASEFRRMEYTVGVDRQNYFQRAYGDVVLAGPPDLIPAKDRRGLMVIARQDAATAAYPRDDDLHGLDSGSPTRVRRGRVCGPGAIPGR